MDLAENSFAHFWEIYHLSDLVSTHIIKVMPLELSLFLNSARYLIQMQHVSELTERSHRTPQTFFNHFAHIEHQVTQLGPIPL